MKKKKVTEKSKAEEPEVEEQKAPPPHPSFSEEEVKSVAEFMNFTFHKAKWELTSSEVQKLAAHFTKFHEHVNKMDSYILEFRKATRKD
jgi:hypothetical protein